MARRFTWADLPKSQRVKLGKTIKAPKASEAEELFFLHVKTAGLALPIREHRFSETGRKWRFDFAWPTIKLAVEIEGLTHASVGPDGQKRLGRHQTIAGYTQDCEKYNQAMLEGWRILHFTPKHVKSGYALDLISQALNHEGINHE